MVRELASPWTRTWIRVPSGASSQIFRFVALAWVKVMVSSMVSMEISVETTMSIATCPVPGTLLFSGMATAAPVYSPVAVISFEETLATGDMIFQASAMRTAA